MDSINVKNELVYKAFHELWNKNQRKTEDNIIHVSEVTGCIRKSYYYRVNSEAVDKIVDINSKIVMTIGSMIHRMIENHMETYDCIIEQPVYLIRNNYVLAGTPDAVCDDVVLEIKTVGKDVDKPYKSHVEQINMYMGILGIDKGYIIYINRANGSVKVFPVKYSEKMFNETLKKADKLWESLRNNKPPEKQLSHECNNCPFRWICYRER